ncbi:MAG: dTDP-4-dehydrorhamnose 3,5-epimerase [Bernardetiaceae bacterium]
MKAEPTRISSLRVLTPKVFEDHRGYFFESYNEQQMTLALGEMPPHFVQDNQSRSGYGVLRGLHFQVYPHAQTKLVRVISGEIFDVVVDIRPDSDTFGDWEGVYLSAKNRKQLFIPPGFAHGFLVVSSMAEILYKCDAFYAPDFERVLAYNDPSLGIDWPLPEQDLILSEKDKKGVHLREMPHLKF